MINPIRAMYIGRRILHEGVTTLEYEEDPFKPYPVFERKGSTCVYVFISDERTNPFFALPSDVDDEYIFRRIEYGLLPPVQHGGKWRRWLPKPEYAYGERIYLVDNPNQFSVDDIIWNDDQYEYYINGAMRIVTADQLTREKPNIPDLVEIEHNFIF